MASKEFRQSKELVMKLLADMFLMDQNATLHILAGAIQAFHLESRKDWARDARKVDIM